MCVFSDKLQARAAGEQEGLGDWAGLTGGLVSGGCLCDTDMNAMFHTEHQAELASEQGMHEVVTQLRMHAGGPGGQKGHALRLWLHGAARGPL